MFKADSLVRRYWRILRPFHSVFATLIIILVLYESLQLLESYSFSLMIRLLSERVELTIWLVFFAGMIIFDEVFTRVDNHVDWQIIAKQSYQLYRFLKLGAIKKFLQLDITWHQKRNSGTLVGKVADGVGKVEDLVGMLSWEIVPTSIQAAISVFPLIFLSPIAAIIAIFSFLFFVRFAIGGIRERRHLKEARFDLYEREWHRSIEIVQSVETNYMFGQTERLIREQEKLHEGIIGLGTKEAHRGVYHYARWQIRISRWARRAILGIWVYQFYTGSLDIPNLIFANILLERLFMSFWRFNRLLERGTESAEGASRLANLLEEQPTQSISGSNTKPAIRPVGVKMEDVCFSYTQDYKADNGGLHDLSLEIPGGSVVALVGPSGAGKTTIRKIITGLIGIQSGTITIGGVNLDDWDPKSLLEQFSYVPQGDDVFLFNETVMENIAFARPKASKEEVVEAAKLAGIHDFIVSLPEGYQTLIGERGKRLSGGQKQRVALARAIIADRPILILDEATSSVDAITEEEIHHRMRKILSGKTAIVIAHRLSTVWDIADKIVVLDKGRKVEEGTHEELVKLGGLYAKMVAIQTKEGS